MGQQQSMDNKEKQKKPQLRRNSIDESSLQIYKTNENKKNIDSMTNKKIKQLRRRCYSCSSMSDRRIPIARPEEGSFKAQYQCLKQIGKGGFSTVFLARKIKTNKEYAVKVINLKELSTYDRWLFLKEVRIMKDNKKIFIVSELMYGGELFKQIINRKKFDEDDARDVVTILLKAILYCHKQGIIHRDLKPENISFIYIYIYNTLIYI
ncbi:hypothetical protein WA158_002559 [Blastocystis sp. Blastoise]